MMNAPEINYDEKPQEFYNKTTGERWRRTGYCCQCGDCCVGNPFVNGPAKAEGMCPLWSRLNEDRAICTDRTNWYYKLACAHWPSEPEHIKDLPRCTYKFSRIE